MKTINLCKDGSKSIQIFSGSQLHSESEPARQAYWPNGNPRLLVWKLDGKTHRENGPAIISFNEKGDAISFQYWKNGMKVNPLSS